jgi:predicted secreted protein
VVIFMVLPWGVKVPDEHEPGHATSAPERPMLWRKAAITTVIAAAIWLVVYYLIESELIQLRPA